MTTTTRSPIESPPREDLVRALAGDLTVRSITRDDGDGRTMVGHFAVFNRWTEIDSFWEGRFLEQVAPGAFKKTMRENRDGMRVLFQHGRDPQIGDKPLGPIDELKEDDTGAWYEVSLLDTAYVREIVPGLEAGLFGASFRFKVIREEFVSEPEPSADNPAGLPERTIKEAQVMEFGPVTFPAYAEASAGLRMRSLTDEIMFARLAQDPDAMRALIVALGREDPFARRHRPGQREEEGEPSRDDTPTDSASDEPAAEAGTGSEDDTPDDDSAADPGTESDVEIQAEGEDPEADDDRTAPGSMPTPRVPLYTSSKEKRESWRL